MIVAGSASPLLLSSAGGYNLTNSLRFRSSASAYLNRTLGAGGGTTKNVFSAWVKRGSLGASSPIIQARQDGNNQQYIGFTTSNAIEIGIISGGTTLLQKITTAVYRDPSSWYHIFYYQDTTLATAEDRYQLYINGVRVTSWSTNTNTASQNTAYFFGTANPHNISSYGGVTFSDQYLAEVNFVYQPSVVPTVNDFGATNPSTGVWQPKKYTGTYGTNGFYLPFTDNSALTTSSNVGLGKDFSGNGNYFATNGISITAGSTYDSMIDVPTLTSATVANYCVLNPLNTGNTPTNGNLTYPAPSAAWKVNRATFSIPETAKAYWEIKISGDSTNNISCGVDTGLSSLTAQLGSTSAGWAIVPPNSTGSTSANKYNNGSSTSVTLPSNSGTNDVYMFAVDRNTNSIWVGINGSFVGTVGTSGQIFNNLPSTGTLFPAICTYNKLIDVNFGQQPFAYTPPTGFVRLNTFNLPTPTIGATASTTANKYMNIALYTGTGSSQSITGLGFQPDWTWIKERNASADHGLYDAVRGVQNQLESNTTTAETAEATGLTAFGSDGFTVGALAQLNTSADTYVAWNWKANGAGSSNTAGTITSTVSANTSAGFSIVTYTGTGANATVGHGLGVAPKWIIVKNRTQASANIVGHSDMATSSPWNGFLQLQSTSAYTTSGGNLIWNDTAPTSSVFSIGTDTSTNFNGNNFVAYCFAQVAGYSAFGSYTGNGSADGPFVFTGFRPRFLMIKATASESNADWLLYDSARNTYNTMNTRLWANLSAAETSDSAYLLDFVSNGFKIRTGTANVGYNNNGGNYIYMAFAENPFKYANAR
jgi:hypothetical protein